MTSASRIENYNHPIRRQEAASNAVRPIGSVVTSPASKDIGPTGLGTWFLGDERNMGGKSLIKSQLINHKNALRQTKAVLADQLLPPHAHITKVKGEKTDFGRDFRLKKKRKRGKSICQTILTRQMNYIDPLLQDQDVFSEVRETRRRIKDIHSGKTYDQGGAVNNKKPTSFAMSKKLVSNRRPN